MKSPYKPSNQQPDCLECSDGEHENYAPIAGKYQIIDPDTGKQYRRGYICEDHYGSLSDDGYKLIRVE